MHTNNVWIGQRLRAWVEIETHFTFNDMHRVTTRYQTALPKPTCACGRVTFSDAYASGTRWGTPRVTALEAKMSLFQPNCRIENYISRSFSATTGQTGPLNACHNTTQQALSAHPYSIASTLSIPDLDEMTKNRLSSPGRGETCLNSCVCEVHEGRYSTDNNSPLRARCVQLIEQERDP